jgi:hypothetical protein
MSKDNSHTTQEDISYLLSEIAKRPYPSVYVVEQDTEEERYIWQVKDEINKECKKKIPSRIPTLDGYDVLQHLSGEMDEDDLSFLKEEVMWICAAKMALGGNDDGEKAKPMPKISSLDELIDKNASQSRFVKFLEALTHEHPIPFFIPPTPRVKKFLEKRPSRK